MRIVKLEKVNPILWRKYESTTTKQLKEPRLLYNQVTEIIPDLTGSGLTAGQAVKGARGMPWHQEPTKDVMSCDKVGGAANKH